MVAEALGTKERKEKLERVKNALRSLRPNEGECRLCPRNCGVNRSKGEKGFCLGGKEASISHAGLHFGEEPVLSGYSNFLKNKKKLGFKKGGSGTIFFSGCNLKCLYCQNYQLSWQNMGKPHLPESIANLMLDLQEKGALNINLVTPTHLLIPILEALSLAYSRNLNIPIVYNSGGYEKPETLKHLEGVVDIYLPDIKYYSPFVSERFSSAPDYFFWASKALKEMHRQQPEFIVDRKWIARKGLILRHLLLPGHEEDSLRLISWIGENLDSSICLSLMSQYRPCFKAPQEIQRKVDPLKYRKVVEKALSLNLATLFIQPEPFIEEEHLIPDFSLEDPFQWNKSSE